MISASKYQHITYFMSLLKVSLFINRPKQRLLCMDTRRGARVSARSSPGRTKTFFSLYGGPFCYFFPCRGICYVFLLVCGLFHNVEVFLLFFSLIAGTFFVFMGDFMSLWVLLWDCPSPYDFLAESCYYVAFIPCPPLSLTAAIMYPTMPTSTPVFNSQ